MSSISFDQSAGNHAIIQVAEQYIFQPNHAARLAVAKSNLKGEEL